MALKGVLLVLPERVLVPVQLLLLRLDFINACCGLVIGLCFFSRFRCSSSETDSRVLRDCIGAMFWRPFCGSVGSSTLALTAKGAGSVIRLSFALESTLVTLRLRDEIGGSFHVVGAQLEEAW